MNIGERIKTLRHQQNISTKELAAKLDIDISTLTRIENGRITTFRADFLQSVASELDVGISDLFEEKGPSAIQDNKKGQNISVLYQQNQWEKAEKLYESLLVAKDATILLLQEQIKLLKKDSAT